MSPLPEDRDELLWELARDPLSEAAQQYRQRYPEDVAELESRAAMLGKLTAAKPIPPAIIPAPHVLLEKPTPEVRMPRWSLGVAAALLVFSLALGYYAVTRPQPQTLATDAGRPSISATGDSNMEGDALLGDRKWKVKAWVSVHRKAWTPPAVPPRAPLTKSPPDRNPWPRPNLPTPRCCPSPSRTRALPSGT